MVDLPVLAFSTLPRPGRQDRLLVLLHGYGEPVADLADRVELIDPDGRFLVALPEAPFERGGRAIWHRAMSARGEAEQQFTVSLAAIDALLGTLEAETGLPAAEAVVGGFSQGGGLGLGLLLAADVAHRPAAAFGVCSFPPNITGFRVDRAAAAGRPYFLSSAHQDHFAPIEVSRSGAALLRDTGLVLTYVEAIGGHVMTDEAATQIGTWLKSLDQGSGPPSSTDLLAGVSGRHEFYEGLWEHIS